MPARAAKKIPPESWPCLTDFEVELWHLGILDLEVHLEADGGLDGGLGFDSHGLLDGRSGRNLVLFFRGEFGQLLDVVFVGDLALNRAGGTKCDDLSPAGLDQLGESLQGGVVPVEVRRRPGEVANEEVNDARDRLARTVAECLDELRGRYGVPRFAAGVPVPFEGSVQLKSL